ncbi:hypothetical protein IWX50DRAFT_649908 [Phyllosticta citricarpa]
MGSISVEVAELEAQRAELQSKLAPKLSAGAIIAFPSSDEFESSNLRFTEYERPVKTPGSKKSRHILTSDRHILRPSSQLAKATSSKQSASPRRRRLDSPSAQGTTA